MTAVPWLTSVLLCQAVRAADGEFRPRPQTLPPRERVEIYLDLIEDFVGWCESSERPIDSDELEPGGGYFNAAGSGVTWSRGNSNISVAYAVLLDAYPERREFTRQRVPRDVLCDHLRKAIRSLCLANKHCSRHVDSQFTWGGPSWQAALGFTGCAWAAHLAEASLDSGTLALVAEVLAAEADNLDKPIPSAKPGDTGAEDCCWNAPLLAFAAGKLADDPRAEKWDALARRWAINATTRPSDRESGDIIEGRPLREWVASENVFPDLTLENHGFWSTPYQYEYGLLGEAEIAYRAFGRPVPEAFAFRAREMWENVTGVISLWDGDSLFPHGIDWAWKDYQHIQYFCRLATCLGMSGPGAFESRALQMVRWRQLSGTPGSVAELDFGYQTHVLSEWAFCVLMHRYFAAGRSVPFGKAERTLLGVHQYPYVKTVIHRARSKLVSVSWHPHSQAILILPEGSTTFSDPPFFVPYDRNSGVADVTVRTAPELEVSSPYVVAGYEVRNLADGDLSTWWVSGLDHDIPGEGPTPESPEAVDLRFARARTVSGVILYPREQYGPRDCELQHSPDGQHYATAARFTATPGDPEQKWSFDPVQAAHWRLVITSAYDPRHPDAPRNAQIREVALIEPGKQHSPPRSGVDPTLVHFEETHRGRGMRVVVSGSHGHAVTQYTTVVSLPHEATVYSTIFHAHASAEVEVGPLFPLRVSAPPEFERQATRYRGRNWLNMGDHMAFVSPEPLPDDLPAGRFYLTEARKFTVEPGAWFGAAAVVVYVRQPHEVTEALARQVRLVSDTTRQRLTLAVPGSAGITEIDLWPPGTSTADDDA